MERLKFSIKINAPKEKVWDIMLNDETYRIWTNEFNPRGSYYEGDWNEGSTIKFYGPDEEGKLDGMISRIKENRKYEYVPIEHLGQISQGIEDTTSEKVVGWKGALENYTFKEDSDGTEVLVEVDTPEEFKDYMNDLWPKALEKLKEISEK